MYRPQSSWASAADVERAGPSGLVVDRLSFVNWLSTNLFGEPCYNNGDRAEDL
jgi:hypothetical protein